MNSLPFLVEPQSKPISVLLVEDNSLDARMFRQLLRRQSDTSINVEVAETLSSATQCLTTQSFDIVVLDLNLPDSRGLQTLRTIQSAFSGPVLILSGTGDFDLTQQALRIGAQDFIVKGEAETSTLTRAMAFAIERGRRLQMERSMAEQAKELELLHEIQESLLRDHRDHQLLNTLTAAAIYPAERASGDYCEIIPIDDAHLLCCVADVSGHGLKASQLMLTVRATVRAVARFAATPDRMMLAVSELLLRDFNDGSFVTMMIAVVNCRTGQVTYCAAGHRGHVIRGDSGEIIDLNACCPPVGIVPFSSDDVELSEIDLSSGDLLFIPTDGVYEVMNAEREQMSKQGMFQHLREMRKMNPRTLIVKLRETILDFTGGASLSDDMTIVCVQFETADIDCGIERLDDNTV